MKEWTKAKKSFMCANVPTTEEVHPNGTGDYFEFTLTLRMLEEIKGTVNGEVYSRVPV